MLDWLRRNPREVPTITVGDTTLPVVIRRLAHARQLTMRLAPDGGEVRVSVPRWARDADALDFVHARRDWLARQLTRQVPAQALVPGDAVPLRGIAHTIAHTPAAARRIRLADGAIHLGGPVELLEPRLARWLKAEARAHFATDLAEYCARAGVAVPALALSNAHARWGSCSARGVVRLNWRLIMAPDAVRRSVVAHEVAHLIHFDHSPRFHGLLGDLFEGDVAAANRWLKQHGRSLYLHFA